MSTEPFTQEQISFLKEHMSQWLAEQSLGKPPMVYEIELRECMVRVEEELRNQRELIQYIIEQMDKRFEQVDKSFEQVDKRFEQIDQRFMALTKRMDRLLIWSFGTTVTVGGLIVAILKLT